MRLHHLPASDPGRCPRLARLGLAVLSSALCVGLLEIGFRALAVLENRGLLTPGFEPPGLPPQGERAGLAHLIRLSKSPQRVYQLRPEIAVDYQGGRVTTNARGWRAPSPTAADTDAVRIVGIGDSVMFGQGVDDEETYLAVLERRLAHRDSTRKWQVFNLAVPGYNTVMEVEALKEEGLALQPQVVVIEFVGNDLGLPNFIRQPRAVLALDRSFLGDFVRRHLATGSRRFGFTPPEQVLSRQGVVAAPLLGPGEFVSSPEAVPAAYRALIGWEAFAAAMEELKALSRERGFAVLWLLLVPGRPGLQDRALALAESLGFVVVEVWSDLSRYLARHGLGGYFGSPLAQGPEDGHPSTLGHALAAQSLEGALIARDLF